MPTARVQLSKTAWTNLGSGPMFLQNRAPHRAAYWAASASDPGNNAPNDIADLPANELGGDGFVRDINIALTQNIWARGEGHVIVTT
jgi:hypothetical protein